MKADFKKLVAFKMDYETKQESDAAHYVLQVCVPLFLFFSFSAIKVAMADYPMHNLIHAMEDHPFKTNLVQKPVQFKTDFNADEVAKFIERHEKFSSTPYEDLNGGMVIGYGFNAKGRIYISKNYAHKIIRQEVERLKEQIDAALPNMELSNEQYTALISLTYNLGGRHLNEMPKFKELLREGKGKEQWENWFSYCNGTYYRGLNKRRKEETKLFYN